MVSSHDHGRVRHHGRGYRSSAGTAVAVTSGHGHRTRSNHHSHQSHHHRGYPHQSRSHRSHRPSHHDRHRISEYNHYKYGDGYEDYESIISPCVKYSLFFFNFIFWVSFST